MKTKRYIIIVGLVNFFFLTCFGQNIKNLERNLDTLKRMEQLQAFNAVTAAYKANGDRKAMQYGRAGAQVADMYLFTKDKRATSSDSLLALIAYHQCAEVLYNRQKFEESQEYFEKSSNLAKRINNTTYYDYAEIYLAEIETRNQNKKERSELFGDLSEKLGIGEKVQDVSRNIQIKSEIERAEIAERLGNIPSAKKHYEKAIELLLEEADSMRVFLLYDKLSELSTDSTTYRALTRDDFDSKTNPNNHVELSESAKPIHSPDTVFSRISDLGNTKKRKALNIEKERLKNLSNEFAKAKNYEKSLEYFKLYEQLSKQMAEDSVLAHVERSQRMKEILLLKQQKQIADLDVAAIEAERTKEIRLRNMSFLITALILLSSLVIYYFYQTKKQQHQQLKVAYTDLSATKLKLEEAEKRIVALLKQQVSDEIASELLLGMSGKAAVQLFVCVMFLDIRGFTQLAEQMTPEDLINFQNDVFGFMIETVEAHHGNVNQLLGDGFMATFGAPTSHGNDCQNAFLAAKKILSQLKQWNINKGHPVQIGIGLHAGSVVAGNVGSADRKQYSITGNTVIIASRVEQLNKKYNSQFMLTREVADQLDKSSLREPVFHQVKIKGRSDTTQVIIVE